MKEDLQKEIERLKKRLEREKKARTALETIIEDKSRDIFLSYEFSKKVLDSVDNLIITTDDRLVITDVNESWGEEYQSILGKGFCELFKLVKGSSDFKSKIIENSGYQGELTLNIEEKELPVYLKGRKLITEKDDSFIFSLVDLTHMKEMEAEKAELQERLIKTAYTDGVAESAIAVLHNIGNVLTALNSRMSVKAELGELKKISGIFKLLSQKWDELEREQITKTFQVIDKSFVSTLEEMEDLYSFVSSKCSHIANIITSQQKYANMKENIRTKTSLVDVLEDCIEIVSDRMKKRSIKVEIDKSVNPEVMAEKIGLSQVLLNLLVNAMESIDDVLKDNPSMNSHSITIRFEDKGETFVMLVKDTGMGIEQEKLKELFNFGYSTKKRGSGFGLHNCANYMKNNKGGIEIESDGLMKGATVSLSFEKAA